MTKRLLAACLSLLLVLGGILIVPEPVQAATGNGTILWTGETQFSYYNGYRGQITGKVVVTDVTATQATIQLWCIPTATSYGSVTLNKFQIILPTIGSTSTMYKAYTYQGGAWDLAWQDTFTFPEGSTGIPVVVRNVDPSDYYVVNGTIKNPWSQSYTIDLKAIVDLEAAVKANIATAATWATTAATNATAAKTSADSALAAINAMTPSVAALQTSVNTLQTKITNMQLMLDAQDMVPPQITDIRLASGGQLTRASSTRVAANVTDNITPESALVCAVTVNGAMLATTCTANALNTFDIPLGSPGRKVVTLVVTDGAGLVAKKDISFFKVN